MQSSTTTLIWTLVLEHGSSVSSHPVVVPLHPVLHHVADSQCSLDSAPRGSWRCLLTNFQIPPPVLVAKVDALPFPESADILPICFGSSVCGSTPFPRSSSLTERI